MNAKTLAKLFVATFAATAMTITASAAFAKKNTYNDQFKDVKSTSWYAKEVASAYELGFVEGVSEKEYSPNSTVTVAQGITMASRVHAEYNGKTISEVSGGKWYDMYVKYAKENSIITENQFDDYTREIKRHEMASLFHDAMGSDYYNAINDIVFIPDVPDGAMYMDKLLTLYNAGVVMGNDEYGSFSPDDNIKRSETAAIINRVAIPENRIKKELSKFATDDAYTLVYNVGMSGTMEGINSGWVLDNRGGSARVSNSGFGALGDVSTKYATAYIREFNYVDTGRLVVELSLTTKDNGAFLEFRDINENTVYMLKIVNGKWSLYANDGTYKTLADANGKTFFRIVLDIDENKSKTYIDDVYCTDSTLLSDNIYSFRTGIDEEGTGSLSVGELNIVVNYGMYENFDMFGIDEVYGWETSGSASVSNNELVFGSTGGTVKKTFDAVSGVVTTETYFITRDGKDFSVSIGDILTVENKGKKLVAGGKELYNLTQNMWYRLRVDADTNSGTAKVWLNGRVIGTVNLAKKNSVSSFEVKTNGLVGIDNIKIYETVEHKDYVPAPSTKASLDDYIVAMNICSLWRNGIHYGWACITPYNDRKPVMGYYDEGVPETADWEIKYMVEHGVDVQAFCWYGDSSSGPLKTPEWSSQLHDGYMYSKYSDYMYYCLMWETSGSKPVSSSQFRNYVIPYWFENYFLDSRYLKIDNKIVLTIYNVEGLAQSNYFGSNAKVKTELDYLDKKAKDYGFDGVIILASGTPSVQMEAMGIDGTYAYSWSKDGKKLDVNKSRISSAAKSSKTVFGVPTVSVGFDSVPWHHLRYGLITKEDFKTALEWVKNEHMPNVAKNTPDWAENLVWLSTWNEFGEGTFICPANQNGDGFGYLDGVRSTLTNLPENHTDVVPTVRQRDRINHLYPQYARLLRREGWYKYEADLSTYENEPKNKLYVNDQDVLSLVGEEVHIPPVEKDGKIYFPFNPSTCVNYILNCYYEWREDAGTLRIEANGHEVMFEVGSDIYVHDGKRENLGYIVETLDDIPELDFVKLAKDLDYRVEEKDGNVYIYTDTYETLWKSLGERKTGTWDFDLYDSEGWDSAHMTFDVGGGTMTMTTNGKSNDPAVYFNKTSFPTDFYTKRFTDLEIKVRYSYESEYAHSISFYFITDKDSAWNETKSIKFQMHEVDTEGEWKIYKAHLADNEAWANSEKITGLRLDPFDTQGTFEIDYIHFIEDPDFVYVEPEKKEFAIINGDAEEDTIAFFSSNAKISIVKEDGNPSNRVYLVQADPGGTYAYFRHEAEFEPGATYAIEFDIKLVGNNVNDPKQGLASTFCCNMRYTDKTASNSVEHIIRPGEGTNVSANISAEDGWIHYTASHTVTNIDSNNDSQFTIYVNPNNGIGFNYYVDNIVCKKLTETEKAKADPASVFDWEKSEGIRYTFDKTTEPFTFSGATGEVKDGVLVLNATNGDPQIQLSGLSLDADSNVAVAVRMKSDDVDLSKSNIEVFFATKKDGELSQDKSSHLYFDKYILDDDGYYTVVVNMGINELWDGTITTIRVDPANAQGTYYIDEIMIMQVKD